MTWRKSQKLQTKAEAVREALKAGKDKPADGVVWIKEKYGIEMNPQHFSSTKSQQNAKAGRVPARQGRAASPGVPTAPAAAGGDPSGLASQVEAIKALVDQLGVEQVVGIARLFGR